MEPKVGDVISWPRTLPGCSIPDEVCRVIHLKDQDALTVSPCHACPARRRFSYNFFSVSTLRQVGCLQKNVPLTTQEAQFHRVDLAIRILSLRGLSWQRDVLDRDGMVKVLSAAGIELPSCELEGLDRIEVKVTKSGYGQGKNHTIRRPTGSSWTAIDLLCECNKLQAMHSNYWGWNGIGVIRYGTHGGVPMFYVGGWQPLCLEARYG